jgi:putative SOS response-associated peptidase YedK
MCGRYTITNKDVADYFKSEQGSFEFAPSYNIAPTQQVPVVLEREGERLLTPAKWGLLPGWVKDPAAFKASMFNARSESVAEKASFKGPLRHKRTVIPASGFYEWRREGGNAKTPHYIRLSDGEPIGFAGLYDLWNDEVLSCTILTTTPNALMAKIHDRMPVILSRDDYGRWLDPEVTDPAELQDLLKPYTGEMQAYPVSSAVNSPRNNGPELLIPA